MELDSFKKKGVKFYEELYTNYFDKLCAYGLSFTSDKNQIQDIVQETFTYLWKNKNKIKITHSLQAYLYRIVYNKLMQFHQQNKKRESILISDYQLALEKAVEIDVNLNNAALKRLEECISKLPTRCKEIFLDKKIGGLKTNEISENLSISSKTIEGHITKAYKFLKSCMNDN